MTIDNYHNNIVGKIKKNYCIKFGIILITFFMIINTASAASIYVSTPSKNVTLGQTFDIQISIDPISTAISGAQLNIEFDKSLLKINSIKEGDIFKQSGANTFFQGGVIYDSLGAVKNIFCVIIGPFNVKTQGTFIIINATAIGSSGKSGINLSNAIISDQNGISTALKVINGSINVVPPLGRSNSGSNIALEANGATASGGINPTKLIDGQVRGYTLSTGYASAAWNVPMTITLDKMYTINKMNVLLWDLDNRYYQYKVETSKDNLIWTTVIDKTSGQWKSWQNDTFTPINVKYIRITGTYNSANGNFHVVELEAYNT